MRELHARRVLVEVVFKVVALGYIVRRPTTASAIRALCIYCEVWVCGRACFCGAMKDAAELKHFSIELEPTVVEIAKYLFLDCLVPSKSIIEKYEIDKIPFSAMYENSMLSPIVNRPF